MTADFFPSDLDIDNARKIAQLANRAFAMGRNAGRLLEREAARQDDDTYRKGYAKGYVAGSKRCLEPPKYHSKDDRLRYLIYIAAILAGGINAQES